METAEHIMNLRPRDELKEIHPVVRHRPIIQAERIAEGIAIHHRTKMPKSIRKMKEPWMWGRNSIDSAGSAVHSGDGSNKKIGSIMTTRNTSIVDPKRANS